MEGPLANLARTEKLPTMRSLDGGFSRIRDPRAAKIVYAQSLSFTAFLIGLRGPAEITAVLAELGRGEGLDRALERSYGEDLDALERRWRAARLD